MNFWYFRFEGKFSKSARDFAGSGVFSSCLVPESDFEYSKKLFHAALVVENIELVATLECFEINGCELDPMDESNGFWIEWYEQCARSKQISFDKWHLYPLENS